MKRVHVLVEGQTEEAFVRDVLLGHLEPFDVFPTPVLLKTKRVKSGGTFRGGVTSTQQVLGDIRRLLGDASAAAVTTMIDYYGLPNDFPGMHTRPSTDPYARVGHVETELATAVGAARFRPHLVLHEYEAWIFSAPRSCAWVFDAPIADQLAGISAASGGPERIDESPATAPSKRLLQLFAGYRKTLHGPMAVGATGVAAVRQACPHAHEWFSWLESLGRDGTD